MDKKTAGLLGAAAALTAVQTTHAIGAPATEPAAAATYRDLLEPVPNALAALKADDAARTRECQPLQEAQVVVRPPYWHRRYYHHHHHHHHHHHGFHVYIR